MIALVITIIVLLILATISIATLTGDNGLLTKAGDAKEETRGASVEEARNLWKINQETDNQTESETAQTLEQLLNDLEKQNLITPKERTIIEETGEVTIGSRSIVFKEKDKRDYVEIGDYVNYNPTILTKDGKTKVEESKLTYSSPKGTAKKHGNGNSEQNFTATAYTKWRVLNIEEDGTVELVSEDVIKTNSNENFILKGAIGYLYAEQELNEVCKIFGYGYGADTTKGGTYTNGGPLDTPATGKIEGTGARNITRGDINKKAGIYEENGQMKYSDGTVVRSNYGDTTNLTSGVYYPTINTTYTNGKSTSAGLKNLKDTGYNYRKSAIGNATVQSMLFNGDYWTASRHTDASTDTGNAYFFVETVYQTITHSENICYGYGSDLHESSRDDYAVRPIVTLKSNVIDVGTSRMIGDFLMWDLK